MIIDLIDIAKQEIADTAADYERRQPGLSLEVLNEIDAKAIYLIDYPRMYQIITKRLWRFELSTIPFQLYYSVVEDVIPILGLVPAKMHPHRKTRLITHRLQAWQSSKPDAGE